MLGADVSSSKDRSALKRSSIMIVLGLAGMLVGAPAAFGGASVSEADRAETSAGTTRANFLPLKKGSYWLYDARDTGANSVGLKQMLVSDQKAVPNRVRATDFVVSIRDQSLPSEERSDAPMIIRLNEDSSIECLDCGGVMLPAQIRDGLMWQSTQGGESCSLIKAPITFRTADRKDVETVIVQCSSVVQGRSSTRVYADGVGLVLALFREHRDGKWVERVERLKEYRIINPARMPPPTGNSKYQPQQK